MSKFLYLTGGWGYGNRGDNAIFAAMIQSLTTHGEYKLDELVITSYDPIETKIHNDVDSIKSLHKILTSERRLSSFWDRFSLSFNFWHRFSLWLWRKTNHKILLSSALQKHLALLKNSRALIMGGGGYFNDAWPDMLYSKYAEIELAEYAKCPVVIYGQTVGPFSDEVIKQSLSKMLNKITAIAYRDEQSKGVLVKSHYNLNRSVLTADEANLLDKAPNALFGATGEKIVIGIMIQNFRPHLGISGETGYSRINDKNQYYLEICDALNQVIKNLECHLVFIPSTTWDVKSNKRVYENIKLNDRSTIQFLDNLTTQDFIAASQQIDLMISTNMHPVILAATGSKPSVAISYHYKLDDYMKSIGLEEYVIRIDNFSVNELVNKINSAVSNKEKLANIVTKKHQEVKKMARKNMEMLNQIVTKEI
jgi:polysaccharide pyruvyl transferase WcaK-like protein